MRDRLLTPAAEAHYSLLVPLAVENPQPLPLEVEVLHGDADQLAHPHTGVQEGKDDRPVAGAGDCFRVAAGEESGNLLAVERLDDLLRQADVAQGAASAAASWPACSAGGADAVR